MFINSQFYLVMELKKVKAAIFSKNSVLIEQYLAHYQKMLSVPKKDVTHKGFITLCSENISYHLLSVYLLLDMIDYFWDGKKFHDRKLSNDLFLINEVNLEGEVVNNHYNMKTIFSLLDKVCEIDKSRLFVFLVPFSYTQDYVLKTAYPGNVLIIYSNPNTDPSKVFLEGVGEFYLKEKLKNRLPNWSPTVEDFIKEFTSWVLGEKSKFKL